VRAWAEGLIAGREFRESELWDARRFNGWLGQLRPGSIGNAEFTTVFMTLATFLW